MGKSVGRRRNLALFEEIRDALPPMKVRELLLAAEGYKVSRTMLSEEEITGFVETMERHGLYVAIYDKKYVCTPDSGKGGWINRYGVEVPLDASSGNLIVYCAATPQDALNAMKSEHSQKDAELGGHLRIPGCCVEHYLRSIDKAILVQNDYVPFTLENTTESYPFSFWNNITAQYFGYSLISFFPCSFNCLKAESVARQSYSFLSSYCPDWAEQFLRIHRSSVVYTEYEGIYLFEGSFFRDGYLFYDASRIQGTLRGILFSAFRAGDRIEVLGRHRGVIMDHDSRILDFQSSECGILIFD